MTITMLSPFARTAHLEPAPGHAEASAVLALSDETGGAFSVLMAVTSKTHEPPPHMHHREHEGLFILEGELTAHVGRRNLHACAGDFVFLPRGIAHTFTVESAIVRMLVIATPGGLEHYFAESHSRTVNDDERAIAAKYGIEYVPSTTVIPDAGTLRPFVRTSAIDNTRLYIDRILTTFYANRDETGGAFAVVRTHGRKGGEPMRHIHHREDECFFVLEGQISVTVGQETFIAPAGTLVYLPQGIPHGFFADTNEAAFLNFIAPGGFEEYFRELSTPVASLTLPPAPDSPPDAERIMAVAAKYCIEYVFSHD